VFVAVTFIHSHAIKPRLKANSCVYFAVYLSIYFTDPRRFCASKKELPLKACLVSARQLSEKCKMPK